MVKVTFGAGAEMLTEVKEPCFNFQDESDQAVSPS